MFQNFSKPMARAILTAFVFAAFIPAPAGAQISDAIADTATTAAPSSSTLDIPVRNAGTNDTFDNETVTHPPLRLTQDKSSIVTLDSAAGSIIVGNPANLNIMADSANRLIVVPRAAGASFFTVLDKNGGLLMQRHVIVGSPKEKYVRIRRTCTGNAANCQSTSTYYCPDMCHQVTDTSGAPASSAASSGVPQNDAFFGLNTTTSSEAEVVEEVAAEPAQDPAATDMGSDDE